MSKIEKLILERRKSPAAGIPVAELASILELIHECPEIVDKRILGIRIFSDSCLLFTTGEIFGGCTGGGNNVLIEKLLDTWKIVEVSSWRS